MRKLLYILLAICLLAACKENTESKKQIIMDATVQQVVDSLVATYGEGIKVRAEKGVKQAAALWFEKDGTSSDFETFCKTSFVADDSTLNNVFVKLSDYFESMYGGFNQMSLNFQKQVHLDLGPLLPIDEMFSAYSPSAHIDDDFYGNKIAFYIILNFPHYSLAEKKELGSKWSRKDWAYARVGDMFASRVPAEIQQNYAKASADADIYISQYNVSAGYLLNKDNKALFPKEMKLLSHWNIRDEIKANYNKDGGLEKQELLYTVMKRIIAQEIPEKVINDTIYTWNPITNKTYQNEKETALQAEPDKRYQMIINNFKALKAADAYYTELDTYIKRAFEGSMEISQEEAEKLFIEYLSAPEMKMVGEVIKKRLGRNMQAFDIWYDGFKARSNISVEELDNATKVRFKDAAGFKNEMPKLLEALKFTKDRSAFISSKIDVDPARGSGHAWGAQMKSMNSHLRTRISKSGMDYKGYNIAMHEFGHNVEQTISLHNVDYYVLSGVPNTAFTEALAFIFQRRDLDMLGKVDSNPEKEAITTLDNCWSLYEIMGVSLLDMQVWKWLYKHPEASAAELKKATIEMAIDIWNKYYAPVFGVKDEPLLAIYSHMVSYPLYLSNYAYGHIIDFQIEEFIKEKSFGPEVERIYKQGRLIPNEWMKGAVGREISIQPILNATKEALKKLDN